MLRDAVVPLEHTSLSLLVLILAGTSAVGERALADAGGVGGVKATDVLLREPPFARAPSPAGAFGEKVRE